MGVRDPGPSTPGCHFLWPLTRACSDPIMPLGGLGARGACVPLACLVSLSQRGLTVKSRVFEIRVLRADLSSAISCRRTQDQ